MISLYYINFTGHMIMRGYKGDEVQVVSVDTLKPIKTFQGIKED